MWRIFSLKFSCRHTNQIALYENSTPVQKIIFFVNYRHKFCNTFRARQVPFGSEMGVLSITTLQERFIVVVGGQSFVKRETRRDPRPIKWIISYETFLLHILGHCYRLDTTARSAGQHVVALKGLPWFLVFSIGRLWVHENLPESRKAQLLINVACNERAVAQMPAIKWLKWFEDGMELKGMWLHCARINIKPAVGLHLTRLIQFGHSEALSYSKAMPGAHYKFFAVNGYIAVRTIEKCTLRHFLALLRAPFFKFVFYCHRLNEK